MPRDARDPGSSCCLFTPDPLSLPVWLPGTVSVCFPLPQLLLSLHPGGETEAPVSPLAKGRQWGDRSSASFFPLSLLTTVPQFTQQRGHHHPERPGFPPLACTALASQLTSPQLPLRSSGTYTAPISHNLNPFPHGIFHVSILLAPFYSSRN